MESKIKCACGCGREFVPIKRNGLVVSKMHPSCRYKQALSKKGLVKKSKNKSELRSTKTPRQKAMDRADQWFSRYIRVKYCEVYAPNIVVCRCYTCGSIKSITNIDNGHWQRRGYKATRFHLNNARPQCVYCNKWQSGKPEIFEAKLIQEIGEDAVYEIKKLAQAGGEDNEIFYREMANKYRLLTNELLKEKEIKKWW